MYDERNPWREIKLLNLKLQSDPWQSWDSRTRPPDSRLFPLIYVHYSLILGSILK